MLLRLQKIIARAGLASLRKAEEMIEQGRVAVDGKIVRVPGTKADPEINRISVDRKDIAPLDQKFYFLFNKPAGYLTTKYDPKGRPTVMHFIKNIGLPVNPVGRLDYDTEGLLILTNDGDLIFKLTHPKFEIDKEYFVEIDGQLTEDKIKNLEKGVELEDGRTAPAQVLKVQAGNRFHLIIHEGRKRQIRRMCEVLRIPVVYLKRLRMGPIALGSLKTGTWRPLDEDEINILKGYVRNKVKNARTKPGKK